VKTLPTVAALLDSWFPAARADGRVALRSIRIDWSESSKLQGSPTFTTFAAAGEVLRAAAAEIEGYINKTQVTVVWADGESYEARIDLKRTEHGHLANVVGYHLAQSCTFRSGRCSPSHLTPEAYAELLAHAERFAPGSADFCARLLDGYALDDGAPAVDGEPLRDPPKPAPTPEEIRAKRGEGAKYSSTATLAEIKRGVQADIKAAIAAGELPAATYKVSARASRRSYDSVSVSIAGLPFALLHPRKLEELQGGERWHGAYLNDEALAVHDKVKAIINAYGYNRSDTQSDYFDFAFCVEVDLVQRDAEWAAASKQ
jgi:hypothetical protein